MLETYYDKSAAIILITWKEMLLKAAIFIASLNSKFKSRDELG
jgi:hypothetical protein